MFIVFQKAAFQDANVCLFVFDCIYFNDISLMDRCVWQGRDWLGWFPGINCLENPTNAERPVHLGCQTGCSL